MQMTALQKVGLHELLDVISPLPNVSSYGRANQIYSASGVAVSHADDID
jgi:hypothetical protein